MTKNEFNQKCKELLSQNEISLDMLIQCYVYLDKQVGKYAYLKKKWANGGISNACYAESFNDAIQNRNEIERILVMNYRYSIQDIKKEISKEDLLISKSNCESIIEIVKSKSFILAM